MEHRLSLTDEKQSAPRVKDPDLLRVLHLVWVECALCGAVSPLSLHHIHSDPRDDVVGNLCMLCGDGVTGCHGLITVNDHDKRRELGEYILAKRHDTLDYLERKLSRETAHDWLRRRLLVAS